MVASSQSSKRKEDWLSRVHVSHMMLLVLALVFGWQWLDNQQVLDELRLQLAQKLTRMDVEHQQNQVIIQQLQADKALLSEQLSRLEANFAAAQNQQASLESLYNELAINRDDTVLAEVEQMLLIAEQQLYLSSNVRSALTALQSADARLQRSEQPAFNGLRKVIAQDMEKLKAVPYLDTEGMSFQLEHLIEMADALPLLDPRPTLEVVVEQEPGVQQNFALQLWHEFWREARQLVSVQNIGEAQLPLLSPEQVYFLRENIKLRLLSARLSLLAHDEAGFRQQLANIRLWLNRYAMSDSAPVKRMQKVIALLSGAAVDVELPNITGSLEAVRNYRATPRGG